MDIPADIAMQWLTFDSQELDGWEAMLSPVERARKESFTHLGRKHEFTLGRAAARALLAERLAVAPEQVPLHVADDGGVEVAGSTVSVSITHSGNHAVAAIAERAIGIDLEQITPRHPRLPRFLLHPDEYDAFASLPLDHTRSLILYWTIKEATMKALRTGFRVSPKKLQVDLDLAAQRALVRHIDGEAFQVRFEERAECYLAVAFSS